MDRSEICKTVEQKFIFQIDVIYVGAVIMGSIVDLIMTKVMGLKYSQMICFWEVGIFYCFKTSPFTASPRFQ